MPVKFDVSGALRVSERLATSASRLEQVRQRAVSSLSRALKPEASRQIRESYNIKASSVSERLAVRKSGDAVELVGYYRAAGLLNFGARASKTAGVSVTVLRADGPQRLRHAFKATGLGGNAQIFERRGPKRVMTKGRYAGERRQPITALYGPSVAQTLRNEQITRRLGDFAMTKLASEVARQFRILD